MSAANPQETAMTTPLQKNLVALGTIDHGKPGLLRQVIGQRGIAGVAEKVAPQALAVALVELLERRNLAAGVGQHQCLVVLHLIYHAADYAKACGRWWPVWRKSHAAGLPCLRPQALNRQADQGHNRALMPGKGGAPAAVVALARG